MQTEVKLYVVAFAGTYDVSPRSVSVIVCLHLTDLGLSLLVDALRSFLYFVNISSRPNVRQGSVCIHRAWLEGMSCRPCCSPKSVEPVTMAHQKVVRPNPSLTHDYLHLIIENLSFTWMMHHRSSAFTMPPARQQPPPE